LCGYTGQKLLRDETQSPVLKLTSDKLKRQASKRDNMKKYANYVVIKDDKGKKRAFYNFHELIKYLDSFKMSFLPDDFTYTIHED
tara:strand:+ start:42 stop:296 length:255 start_codon:yes stop_codon:yes gene_type:complete